MIGERVIFYKDKKGVVKDKFCGLDSYSMHTGKPSPYGGEIVEEVKITVDFYLILGDDGETYKVRCDEVSIEAPKVHISNFIIGYKDWAQEDGEWVCGEWTDENYNPIDQEAYTLVEVLDTDRHGHPKKAKFFKN